MSGYFRFGSLNHGCRKSEKMKNGSARVERNVFYAVLGVGLVYNESIWCEAEG